MKIYPIEAQPVSRERQFEVCVVLYDVWKDYPHMRLSQLISNAIGHYYQQQGDGGAFTGDIYYIENQLLIDALRMFQALKHPRGANG